MFNFLENLPWYILIKKQREIINEDTFLQSSINVFKEIEKILAY